MIKIYSKNIILKLILIVVLIFPSQTKAISETLTGDATNVIDTEAVLSGSLIPDGAQTSGYFRYSTMEIPPIFCNDIYGSNMRSTFEENLGSGQEAITFSSKVVNLDPGTTYYFCTVGSNQGEITYGGVKSFTTLGIPGDLMVTTKSALVKNATSAIINGSYISGSKSKTWFEYRKYTSLGTEKWIKIKEESHEKNETGSMTTELTGLSKGTQYEFRAAILDTSGIKEVKEGKTPETIYGDMLTFKTKDSGNINPGPVGNGVPNEIPCDDPLDPNCNGTGGTTTPPTGTLKPDLTAGKVAPLYGKVNTPIILMSLIRNQGKVTTKNNFYSFFQISLTKPVIENPVKTNSNSISYLSNKILKTKTVLAETNNTQTSQSIINLPAVSINAIPAGSNAVLSQTYSFSKVGTYYLRACADKSFAGDSGLIIESNEGNNCSSWVSVSITLDGTPGGEGSGGGSIGNGGGSSSNNPPNTNPPFTIGETRTPPVDAVVHYREGIETVLQRQIVANTTIAKVYGYEEGADINSFAWYLSDILARIFGYVSDSGKEIRVAEPDIAAYQIDYTNGKLTIYEYYASKIVNIQQMTPSLRGIYGYEYYFRKR